MKVEFTKKFIDDTFTSVWETEIGREYSWPELRDCHMWPYMARPTSGLLSKVVINIGKNEYLYVEDMLVQGLNIEGVMLLDETTNVSYNMDMHDFVNAVTEKRVSDGRVFGPFKLINKLRKYSLDIAWE